MDTQLVSGIVGATCLAFAAIGTFLLIPDRELTIRERLGIHTIFWAFVIYAIWIIYIVIGSERGWDKYFYMSLPFLLGLLLSLLAELNSKKPPFNVADERIKQLTLKTWDRLPNGVKRALQSSVMNVQSIPEWSLLDKEAFKPSLANAAKWYPILPFPARGLVHISESDCKTLSDEVVTGAIAHEFATAYQTTKTPFDTDAISKAGNILTIKWGFKKEIAALNSQG
jgi:hypothetical protein